jgi:hypothetical protein
VDSSATVFDNIQAMDNWQSCSVCAGAGGNGPAASHGLTQHVSSPSLSGNAAQFWLGGSTPYSDVLWWRPLADGGDLNNNAHHFVYDLQIYLDNPGAAEAIEFDIDQYVQGRSLIFGSQCDYRGDGQWDVYDNANHKWVSTGIGCPTPGANSWTHLVLEVERTSDNSLRYISLTINGDKHNLDWTYPSTSSSFSGMDVNFQLDGNSQQENYSTWVDNMKLSVW